MLAPVGRNDSARAVRGIPCAQGEHGEYHVHQHLTVYVKGEQRLIPYGIGIGSPIELKQTDSGPFVVGGRCFSWLHTHALDGIVHVEAPARRAFTLGDFFAVWGQPLGPARVGPARGRVTAFVNGKRAGDPRRIRLSPHAVIQLDVGTPVVRPQRYRFPAGL